MSETALDQTTTAARPGADAVLRVEDLRTWFFTSQGIIKAVDGVSFAL